jgi:hypothetical protein
MLGVSEFSVGMHWKELVEVGNGGEVLIFEALS